MMDVFVSVKCAWRKVYGRKWIAVKDLGRAQKNTRDSGPRISTEEIAAMMLDPLSIG
jgi:hypothetical protein